MERCLSITSSKPKEIDRIKSLTVKGQFCVWAAGGGGINKFLESGVIYLFSEVVQPLVLCQE